MDPKVIRSDAVKEQDFGSIAVKEFFDDEKYTKFSVARVRIKGEQKFGKDTQSDMAYYVLDGSGKFYIGDEVFEVSKGDLVVIPKNTFYKDEGKLTLLALAVPRFDRTKRVRKEK